MDCNTARLLTTFFGRNGSEIAAEDAAALEAHLNACPKCAQLVKNERAFDDRIAKAMNSVAIPVALKSKVIDSLANERGAWYRRKAFSMTGMAAVVMIAIGGYIGWQIQSADNLSLTRIISQADQETENPQNQLWRLESRYGVKFNPERAFDMTLLASVGTSDLQGRELPMLYFRNVRKNADARVFIVRDTDFNWKKFKPDDATSGSKYGYQVAMLLDAKKGSVAYVILYTGDSLELFLENRSSL